MNTQLFLQLNGLVRKSVFGDTLIIFFAQFLIFLMGALLLVYLLMDKTKNRKLYTISFIASGVVLAHVIVMFLKNFFAIPRPFLQFPYIIELFSYGGMDSFPSGHATFSALIAMFGYLQNKKLGIILFFCAFLVGVTRIISGVHFPVDILVGYVLGISVAFFMHHIFKK